VAVILAAVVHERHRTGKGVAHVSFIDRSSCTF
jgi:hypothetical protein